MEELLRQLREGEFEQENHCLLLNSGVRIWTANGRMFYKFHPESGDKFSWWERIKIGRAIKEGRIKQALKVPNALTSPQS